MPKKVEKANKTEKLSQVKLLEIADMLEKQDRHEIGNDVSNQGDLILKAPEKPISKSELEKIKKKVFQMEKTNNNKLVVFVSKNGWYKIGGRSALIYYYRLAKKMNLSPRLVADTDFFSKFKEGIVSIRRIETLEKNLKKLKIYRNSALTVPYKIYVFDLGYEIDEHDFYLMEHDEEIRRKKFNQMVMPKVAFPEIHSEVWKVTKNLYNECRKLPVVEREFLGKAIFEQITRTHKCFILMSNGHREAKKALLEIMSAMESLKCFLKMGLEYEVWNTKTVARVTENLVKTERLVEGEIKRLMKDEA